MLFSLVEWDKNAIFVLMNLSTYSSLFLDSLLIDKVLTMIGVFAGRVVSTEEAECA